MRKELNSLRDTEEFAKEFLASVLSGDEDRNVILLEGDLGAGKTTFSQFLLREIGAEGPFTSPTFVIMKKYDLGNQQKKNVYHLDCYRVDKNSVLDLGWEELIFNKNNLLLVEWPGRIEKIWPEKYWLLKFEYGENNNSRVVTIEKK